MTLGNSSDAKSDSGRRLNSSSLSSPRGSLLPPRALQSTAGPIRRFFPKVLHHFGRTAQTQLPTSALLTLDDGRMGFFVTPTHSNSADQVQTAGQGTVRAVREAPTPKVFLFVFVQASAAPVRRDHTYLVVGP